MCAQLCGVLHSMAMVEGVLPRVSGVQCKLQVLHTSANNGTVFKWHHTDADGDTGTQGHPSRTKVSPATPRFAELAQPCLIGRAVSFTSPEQLLTYMNS